MKPSLAQFLQTDKPQRDKFLARLFGLCHEVRDARAVS